MVVIYTLKAIYKLHKIVQFHMVRYIFRHIKSTNFAQNRSVLSPFCTKSFRFCTKSFSFYICKDL